ncbi:MAG: heat shock protein HslJ [Spirosomataceae bacterium]|jgi:heat shock protein HslJ
MKYLLFILPFLLAMKCETNDVNSKNELTGEWFVKQVFLGDVIDTPCGYEAKNAPQLTIKFSDEKNEAGMLSFSGNSAVNSFFGTYKVTAFDESTGQGTVSFGLVGATKMAGPEELMACEGRFFSILEQTTDFSIFNENGKDTLRIGRFKKDDKPSRDGGTFLIMERL